MNKRRKLYLLKRARFKALAKEGAFAGIRCSDRGDRLFCFDRFDAEACLSCDKWTEKKCGDPNCGYCAARPILQSQVMAECKTDRLMKQNLRDKYALRERGRRKKAAKGIAYYKYEYDE